MLAESSVVEGVQVVGSTAAGALPDMSAQGVAGFHRIGAVPRMGVQWPELADGTPVTPTVRNGGLTLADSALCGGVVGIKCLCQSVGEQMGC